MQRLIIVFALVACSFAAPLDNPKELVKPEGLTRPSPINPDIPSDPKPEEKITLIADPKVVPLNSTEPTKLTGPFVLPRELLLRTKREEKDSSESDESSSSEEDKKPSKPLVPPPTASIQKLTSPVESTSASHSSDAAVTPSTLASTITPAHPRLPYSPTVHQHNEHLFKPTTESHSTSTTVATTPQDHVNDKRDIPVPLTRKFHHNDDNDQDETKQKDEPSTSSPSNKVPKEEINQEEKKDTGHKAEPATTSATTTTVADHQHPATFARPIPVAELFAKKPSTE